MIRGLAMVAVGGALLSVVCISASGALSPGHWHVPGLNWTVDSDDDDTPSIHLKGDEPAISRDLPWAGGEELAFDVPAHVVFTQGPQAKITVSGPQPLVSAVKLDGSTLKLTGRVHNLSTDHGLTIAVTAPALHQFVLNSAQKLEIHGIVTDELSVTIDGAGAVTAQGGAKSVELQINGAGAADLKDLTVNDAQFEIDGLGHIVAGPTGDVHVEINGAGSVTLTKRPGHLEQEINGAGSVNQPPATPGQSL